MKWRGDSIEFEVYGTSHAPEIGVNATGLPAVDLDLEALNAFMERRRAKKAAFSTAREAT